MRYRTSGLLAWASLAIIIGVPTTETLLSKRTDTALISKDSNKPNDLQFLINEMNVVKTKDKPLASPIQAASPVPITSPIPIEFRLVGEQKLLVSKKEAPKNIEDLQAPSIRVVGDVGQTIGSNIKANKKIEVANNIAIKKTNDIIYELSHNPTLKVENGIDEDFLKLNASKIIPQNAPIMPETPEIDITQDEIIPVVVAKKHNNIIQIGNNNAPKKLKVIKPKLQKVNFYDLVSARRESANINAIRYNDRKTQRGKNLQQFANTGNKTNSQFSDVINIRSNNVFMSKGSFISQLPARRGSKVRLDLVN